MQKLRFLSFISILIASLLFAVACGGGGGSSGGSEGGSGVEPTACRVVASDEIAIDNASQLANIGATGKYVLTDNIFLTGVEWTPLGAFSGELDGSCYKITGLTISNNSASDYNGLFRELNGAKISNLVLENVNFEMTVDVDYSDLLVGSIAGLANNSEIKNSHSTGEITVSSSENPIKAGGLVGKVLGSNINDSYSAVVIGASTTNGTHEACAGGIAGSIGASSSISDSHNTGSVNAYTDNYDTYAGGIVGLVDGGDNAVNIIKNSYNTGAITASSPGFNVYAGGIAGSLESESISDSYNTGAIKASSDDDYAFAGGIAGGAFGDINNSYSTGSVRALSVDDYTFAGGVVGELRSNSGSVNYSYSTGEILADSGIAQGHAGGIVGAVESDGVVKNCVAINPSLSAEFAVGRIIGYYNVVTANYNLALKSILADGDASFDTYDPEEHGIDAELAALQSQVTYEDIDWDFTTTWKMDKGISDYPVLSWQ